MTNADMFKKIFGTYATELWSKPEDEFLEWLNSKFKQPNVLEGFTESEKHRIGIIFQNYYCAGISAIAEDDEINESIFKKVGLIDG